MVNPAIIAAGIGAAGNIFSGLLGRSSSSTPDTSTFYQNWRNDDMAWAREQFDRNEALQREFAQNGIRWRAEDARAAGLHPLAALGSSGASASPISVGGGGNYSVDMGRSSTTGPDFRGLGQDLQRAYLATRTPEEKVASQFELARQAQELQRGDLVNEELRLRIARQTDQVRAPSFPSSAVQPIPGQPSSGPGYEMQPAEPTYSTKAGAEPGPAVPGNRWVRNPDGSVLAMPAKSLNIDEVTSPGGATWTIHNRLLSYNDESYAPPKSMLPQGAYKWQWTNLGWYPVYHQTDINISRGKSPWAHLPSRPADYSPYGRPQYDRRR